MLVKNFSNIRALYVKSVRLRATFFNLITMLFVFAIALGLIFQGSLILIVCMCILSQFFPECCACLSRWNWICLLVLFTHFLLSFVRIQVRVIFLLSKRFSFLGVTWFCSLRHCAMVYRNTMEMKRGWLLPLIHFLRARLVASMSLRL